MNSNKLLDHKIFECLAGSVAYGTNTPESDVDKRGVFIAPPEYSLSCFNSVEQIAFDSQDIVYYELRKFMKLAAESNPNIIELLYMPQECVLYENNAMICLIKNRHLFLSKKAKHTFSGYAMSQLKRIKGHSKWIQNPQSKEKPHLRDYIYLINEKGNVVTDKEQLKRISKWYDAYRVSDEMYRIYTSNKYYENGFFTPDGTQLLYRDGLLNNSSLNYAGVLIVQKEAFSAACVKHQEYWRWKNNRNPVRAKMEEDFGIDGKHAAHLVRLMTMGKEILETGEVIVKRPDAQYLRDIRNGKYGYDYIVKWAEDMDARLTELYDSSSLQESSDHVGIDRLYREIVTEHWGWKEEEKEGI